MQSGGNKVLVWLVVFLATAALLLALAFRKVGNDTREAMINLVDRLKMEASSRKVPRSVLTGKPSPGNAWDEYSIALNDSATWRNDENGGVFQRFAKGDTHLDRAQVERLVAEHAKAIDHLRFGAQRSDGEYPYDWNKGSQMPLPSLLGCRRLAYIAVAQAKINSDRGGLQRALDLLLDTSVFGRDLAADGPILTHMIGLVVYATTFDEFKNLILSGKLTKNQLADLAQKLQTVDHDFPALSSSLSAETLGLGLAMLHASENGLLDQFDLTKQWGWRFTLTPGPAMLEVLEEKETYLHRAEKLERMKFAEVRKEIDAISVEVAASPNARVTVLDLLRIVVTHRDTLAHLRLLRAAATFLATGEMPPIADPFGDNLLYKQEGNKLKIWSIGSDQGAPGIAFEIQTKE
jgi:hypothetical protein